MAEQPVFLKVYHSDKLVTSRQFMSDQISIGSSADGPSLVLADPSVSFWHALIEKRGEEYYISDLGTSTGTFVNSNQILESPLRHGDEIKAGDFVINFFIGVPFAKAGLKKTTQVQKTPGTPTASAFLSQKQSETSSFTFPSTPHQPSSVPPQVPPHLVPPPQAGSTPPQAPPHSVPPQQAGSTPPQVPPHLVPPPQAGSTPPQVPPHSLPPQQAGSTPSQAPPYSVPPPQAGSTPSQAPPYSVPPQQAGSTPPQASPHSVPPPQAGSTPSQAPPYSVPPQQAGSTPPQVPPHSLPPQQAGSTPSQAPPHSVLPQAGSTPHQPSSVLPQAGATPPQVPPHSIPPPQAGSTPPQPSSVPPPQAGSTPLQVPPHSVPPQQVASTPPQPSSVPPQARSTPLQVPPHSVPPQQVASTPPPQGPPQPSPDPPPPLPESESVLYESQSTQKQSLENLSIPEFTVTSFSKIDKQVSAEEKDQTGVSTLKETEVLFSPTHPTGKENKSLSLDSDSDSDSFSDVSSDSPIYQTEEKVLRATPLKQNPGSRGTYAPRSEIQDLNHSIPTGNGPIVEVSVAWKERILSMHHFFKDDNKNITFGSHPSADICCPNLTGQANYTLLKIGQQTSIYLSDGVKASVVDRKGNEHPFEKLVKKGLIATYGSQQTLSLNQNQLVRLDFSPALKVYIRYTNRSQKALYSGLFDFNFSEMMGLMMSFFFMSMLFFYLALFSPQFLSPNEDLQEEAVKKATIVFKKKPNRPRPVKLKMSDKVRKVKISIPNKKKVPKKSKKAGVKIKGRTGRLGEVAAKRIEKSKKKTITSARPGGSVNTKKAGGGPKSPSPDPTKVGLLGVFGKKGTQQELDKAYSGTEELAGLAKQATGYAGQQESYTGKGIGTQFKNTGAGGKGSALIGVSAGIKTKGRGGGVKGYGTGGSLGSRGVVQLQLGTSDWTVEGGVDKNAILRVIRRNKHQLEWCYEFALQKKPDLEGKVLVQWDIVNERVRGTKVKRNTTNDSALARCLISRLRNFRFTGTGLKKGQIGEVSIPFVVTKK